MTEVCIHGNKRVSIIVFYKNVGMDLKGTVNEILAALKESELTDYQVILVDDGSNDTFIDNFEVPKEKFVQVKLKKSVGIAGAILEGTQHALFEDILIIPGHNMYDSKAISNVLGLVGLGRVILGSRDNLQKERPYFKRLASRIMRDIYRHLFYYYVGDIHGLAIYKKADIQRFLRPTDGHAQGIIVVTSVLNEGGLLVQTLAPIKLGHKIARSRKLSNNFPNAKQVYKIIRKLIFLRKIKNKKVIINEYRN